MKTVRRPPYPKWNPGYFPCSSLTPLPLSSRRPSVSFGGFGLSARPRRRAPDHAGRQGRVRAGVGEGYPHLRSDAAQRIRPPERSGHQRHGRLSVGHTHAHRSPSNRRLPARRESPERAQPSLVRVWGYPQTLIRSASRQGSRRTSGTGTGAQPCVPTNSGPNRREGLDKRTSRPWISKRVIELDARI